MTDATSGNNDDGGVALLDETEIDPEVAAIAAEAVRKRTRRRAIRRHDIDFEPRDRVTAERM